MYRLDISSNRKEIDEIISKIPRLNEDHVQFIKSLIQLNKDTDFLLMMLIRHFCVLQCRLLQKRNIKLINKKGQNGVQ